MAFINYIKITDKLKNRNIFNELHFIKKKSVWILISIYILFIYISLPFLPAIVGILSEFFTKEFLNFLSLVLSVLFFMILSVWIFKKKYHLKQFLIIISPLFLLTFWSVILDVWVERIHFIEYAVLGLQVSTVVNVRTIFGIIFTCCFITLTGLVDEIIQWILPNRVGDIRDVFMNSGGGLVGLWIGRFLFWEKHSPERYS